MPWLVALAAALVYSNALRNGFVLDDEGVILRNPLVHGLDGVWRAFAHPYWPAQGGQYRPLVISSFAVDWALWGARAAAFHAVNVGLHALASVLVYVFARRWLSFGGAAIAALIFAVHPVHVEAVANVVGRAELMAACGVLAMLLLHERRSPWALVAFAAALLSKEHAIVAPALAALFDLAGRRASATAPQSGSETQEPRRAWPLYGAYVALAMAWLAVVATVFHSQPMAVVDMFWRTMDAPARWLTMLGVVPTWTRLWFAPFDLSVDYSPRATLPWPDNAPTAAVGAALLVAALLLAAFTWSRARHVSVSIAWLALAVAPVANLLVPTGVIVAERTLYLSSVGAALLIGAVAERLGRRHATAAAALALVLVVAFAARVWTRTPVWFSNRVVLLTTAASHPHASSTHILLARVYARTGDFDAALGEYRTALALFDRSPVVWAEAIEAAARAGLPGIADSLVVEAHARAGVSYLVSAAHASAALGGHRYAEALRAARAATALAPDSARGYLLAARAWLGLAAPDSARRELIHIPAGHPLAAIADSIRRQIALPPPR